MDNFKRRFYDSHPALPLDPDSDKPQSVRPMHTDWAHVVIVAAGAFAGTLARYEIGLWAPTPKNGWPFTIFWINTAGAFLLGLLLQALAHRGKDEGGLRIVRLLLGTGFLGAFTTYSSLATGVAMLARGDHWAVAATYAITSVVLGIASCALGVQCATRRYERSRA